MTITSASGSPSPRRPAARRGRFPGLARAPQLPGDLLWTDVPRAARPPSARPPARDHAPRDHAPSHRGLLARDGYPGDDYAQLRDGQPASSGAPAPGRPVRVRLASAEALLAAVPSLLGFHPSHSLVVLGLTGPRDQVTLTFRYDLPGRGDTELAADIAVHACEVLTRQDIPAVAVIGYGPPGLVTTAAGAVVAGLLTAGLEVRGVLRAEGGRYWLLGDSAPDAGPSAGVSFDPCSHPAAAALAAAGLDVMPDRAALARSLQPPPGTAPATRLATTRALRRLDRVAAAAARDGADPAAAVARAGCGTVRSAISAYRAGTPIADRGRLAFLAVAVSGLRVRDDAWARMDPGHHRAHRQLWTDVVTAAAPEFVPAAAALLAFTAWQAGEGALANVAVERALAADPAYSMALLIGEAVQAGFPPSAARLPMTPEEVADSYAAAPPGTPAMPDGDGPGAAR